jgi:hypothetical protein
MAEAEIEESDAEEEEEEEEHFEVECVIGERIHSGRTQFLLKWRSFDSSEASWEYEEDTNCPDLVEDFRLKEKARQAEKQRYLCEQSFARIDTLEQLHDASPKLIVSAFMLAGTLYYRVSCANNKYHSVPADLLRALRPKLICDYLENKIEILRAS